MTATRAPLQGALPIDVDRNTHAPWRGASPIDVDTRAPLRGALAAARPRAGRATQQKELHSCYTVSSGAGHGEHHPPCAEEEVAALCAAHNTTVTATAEVAAALTEHSFTGVPSLDVPVTAAAREGRHRSLVADVDTTTRSNDVFRARPVTGHSGTCSGGVITCMYHRCLLDRVS